jgi:tetratricopeptide (TPR) repeat protein
VFLVHSLLDYDYYIGAIGLVFWFLLGLIAHYAQGEPALQPLPQLQAQPAEAPKTRRRAGHSPQPAPAPSLETGFHQLPWPSAPAGRAAAAIAILLCLYPIVSPPVHNALGENALRFGDGAYAAAISAHGNRDVMGMRNYFDIAYDSFKRATELDPGWSAAWERYGVMLSAMGRPNEGEEAIRKSLALEPTNFQPYLSLARLYYEQADSLGSSGEIDSRQQAFYQKAAEAYAQSLARYPTNTRALRRLGAMYQQLGDTENAVRTYRRMEQVEKSAYNKFRALEGMDVDTEYAYAHYQLGRAAMKDYAKDPRRVSLTEAESEFNAAIGVVSAYQTTGKRMDEMFRMIGQPRENRGAEMRMVEARSRYRLADVYTRLGDTASAAAQRANAVALLPDVAQAVLTEDGGKPF